MGFEVDFLPVGDGASSGDAIAIRFGNLRSRDEQCVITIDGGTVKSGEALCRHIETHYDTKTVDLAILTHPDQDHASGMRVVMETMDVRGVMMHRPWNHSDAIKHIADDKRVTISSLANRAEEQFIAAKEVEEAALKTLGEDSIIEPFAGVNLGGGLLKVLGPTIGFYREQVAKFRSMPNATSTTSTALITSPYQFESQTMETLVEPHEPATSFENNSSAILLIEIEGHKMLFTGDAGMPALRSAFQFATAASVSVGGLKLFQVPHHGSRKNMGPSFLNYLFGQPSTTPHDCFAIVSAGEGDGLKHPNLKIVNALTRRGVPVYATAGRPFRYFLNAPTRGGYGPVPSIPLAYIVPSDYATS